MKPLVSTLVTDWPIIGAIPPSRTRTCLLYQHPHPNLSPLQHAQETHHVEGLLRVVHIQIAPKAGLKCGQVDVQVCGDSTRTTGTPLELSQVQHGAVTDL